MLTSINLVWKSLIQAKNVTHRSSQTRCRLHPKIRAPSRGKKKQTKKQTKVRRWRGGKGRRGKNPTSAETCQMHFNCYFHPCALAKRGRAQHEHPSSAANGAVFTPVRVQICPKSFYFNCHAGLIERGSPDTFCQFLPARIGYFPQPRGAPETSSLLLRARTPALSSCRRIVELDVGWCTPARPPTATDTLWNNYNGPTAEISRKNTRKSPPPISAPSMHGNEKEFNTYILFKGYGDVEEEDEGEGWKWWEGRGRLEGDP